MRYPKITIYTFVVNILLLTLMVPGGPIETRSFANIDPVIVIGFNVFLTLLTITSVVSVYFMCKKQRWAYQLTGVLGFAFMLVFILDLAKIFPVSFDPMGMPLFIFECVSLLFGAIVMWLSYKTIFVTEKAYWAGQTVIPAWAIFVMIGLLLLGICVVYFATHFALQI